VNSVSFSFIVYSVVPLKTKITEDANSTKERWQLQRVCFRFVRKFNLDQLTRVCIYIVEHRGVNWSMQLTFFFGFDGS